MTYDEGNTPRKKNREFRAVDLILRFLSWIDNMPYLGAGWTEKQDIERKRYEKEHDIIGYRLKMGYKCMAPAKIPIYNAAAKRRQKEKRRLFWEEHERHKAARAAAEEWDRINGP